MTMTRWFRQHQRYMIAGLVILLMASWGVLSTVRSLVGTPTKKETISGRTVQQADLEDGQQALTMMLRLGLLSGQTPYYMTQLHAPIRATVKMRTLASDFASFVFAGQEGQPQLNVTREATWRYLVLLYDAEAEGVEVTDGEITELLDSLPQFSDQNGFNRDAYAAMLAQSGWTDAAMNRWFTQMCRVAKLINLEREAVLVSNAELWMAYVYSAESVRINYVGLDASLFRPLVQVTDEELQEFYDQHRDELPADSKDGIGYKAPQRVRAEYALVSVDQLAKQVQVTDKEVSDYYDAHKEDYRLPEESKPKTGADEEKPAEPQYKPLKDVSDEIRQKLIATKAKEEAEKTAGAIVADLQGVRENYENMPQPLEQMARRHGAEFQTVKTAGGRALVSSEELASLVPDGSEVAQFAFDAAGANVYFPKEFDSPGGPIIFQVLDFREPETQTFDQVKDDVRKDCLQRKAVESAKTFAEKLKEEADKSGLEVAAADMSKRLANLLKTPADEALPTLKVTESASFRRVSPSVAGIEGGTQKDLIDKAFALAEKQSAVVTTGTPASYVYVIQVSQRTPASADDFSKMSPMTRMLYTNDKQRREVQAWMQTLLERSPETTKTQGQG